MRRKRTTKTKEHLHKHARRRAMERLGITLSKALRREIIAAIQSGDQKRAKCIVKQSLVKSVFDVNTSIGEIRVAYDTKRHAIRTVLTKEMDPMDLLKNEFEE
jgi:hypothetical protein